MAGQLATTQALKGLRNQPIKPNEFDNLQHFHPRPIPGDPPVSSEADPVNTLPQGPDPFTKDALDLQTLRSKQLDEMARNREVNPMGAGATVGDIGRLQSDIADDPFTGVAAHHVQDQALNALKGANQAGFENTQEASRFGRNLELKRIEEPLSVAKQQGANSLDVVKEQNKGVNNKFELLQELLSRGAITPGSQFNLGGGVGIRNGQALPSSAGRPLADELTKKIKARNDLNNPGATDWFQNQAAALGVPGMHSTQERGANMDNEIKTLQSQLSGQGQNPVRQHAIEELTKAGYPVSEENIQEVIKQLTGR